MEISSAADPPRAADPPDLATLQRRAADRVADRARGAHRPSGHIVCDGLVRIYQTDGIEVVALQGLDLVINRGELAAIVGASGSGKSTLLNILSGLDMPTAGSAWVADYDLLKMSARQRLRYRRHTVGFIWQQAGQNLLPYLTAAQNVALPMRLAGWRRRAAASRAAELLALVGMGDGAHRRPAQLSGGEQQRTAVAVAVANDPAVLLADEPTGELDETTAAEVFVALRTMNAELGVTIVVVTHDPAVSDQVRRTISIQDGRTATEVHRDLRAEPDGQRTAVAQEFAVLDRSGRVQLPRRFLQALDLHERVRLQLEPDHVSVRPGHSLLDPPPPRSR